ncbi:MAG: hypothetical protein AAF557_09425 [Pseudomonadota bacterium]
MARILFEFGVLKFMSALTLNGIYLSTSVSKSSIVNDVLELALFAFCIIIVGFRYGRRNTVLPSSGFCWAVAVLVLPVMLVTGIMVALILNTEDALAGLGTIASLSSEAYGFLIGFFLIISAVYMVAGRLIFRFAAKRGTWKAAQDIHEAF